MSEILSYEKFVENLRAYLLDALNLQEERIYFKVKAMNSKLIFEY